MSEPLTNILVRSQTPAWKAVVILVSCAIAAIFTGILWHSFAFHSSSGFFLVAVLICSLHGGMRSGLIAALIGLTVVTVFYAQLSPQQVTEHFLMRQAIFALLSAIVSAIGAWPRNVNLRLYESERRFKAMADDAPVLIWMSGTDKLCDFFNQGWLAFTGRTLQQEVGKGWEEAVHPDDQQRCWEIYMSSFDARRPFEIEYRLRRFDGEYRWILDHGVPRYSPGQQFLGYIGSCMDVTGLKNAEAEIRSSRHRLALAQEAAKLGTWEWDLQTNQVIWSEQIEGFHEIHPKNGELTFDEWLARVHRDDQQSVSAALKAAITSEKPYDAEFRVVRPDGSICWVAARGTVIHDRGLPVKMVGIGMDVTERRQQESALRETEKLAATGRLAATIAHEINNPLEAVTNIIFLVRGMPNIPEDVRVFLDTADSELSRVAHIARQTLGFYRDASSPVQLKVDALVQDVLQLYSHKINQRRIHSRVELKGDVEVVGFSGELRQIFSNLITNAIDAMPLGGALRVRVKQSSKGAQITIADNGSGIPDNIRSKIFRPFFTTKERVGTGLGLWLTKNLVEKHGGKIQLRSSVAQGHSGTTFRVFLPSAFFEAKPQPIELSISAGQQKVG